MFSRKDGKTPRDSDVPNHESAALAPSLRQYELDQVQRVTALFGPDRVWRSGISAP